jgi:Alpha/beta hydrolase of unknown function (DUF900)
VRPRFNFNVEPAFSLQGKLNYNITMIEVRKPKSSVPESASCDQITADSGAGPFEDELAPEAQYRVVIGNKGESEVRFLPLTEFKQALIRAGQRALERKVPLVVYVHGFNKTFLDSLDQVAALDGNYDCEVVALSWPSGDVSVIAGALPISETRQATLRCPETARVFRWMVESLSVFETWQARPLCTLVHRSLGAHVLRLACEQWGEAAHNKLSVFRQILLSAAGTPLLGSGAWLRSVDVPLAATLNCNDWILSTAVKLFGEDAQLGGSLPEKGVRALNVTYLDVTPGAKIGAHHDYLLNVEGESAQFGMDTRVFLFHRNAIYGIAPIAESSHLYRFIGDQLWSISAGDG